MKNHIVKRTSPFIKQIWRKPYTCESKKSIFHFK